MSNFIVSAEQAVKILNEAFAIEGKQLDLILCTGSRVSEELANHPTIQCSISGYADRREFINGDIIATGERDPIYKMSFIGLLNGIFGVDANGQGSIARIIEDGELKGFCINTNLAPNAEPDSIRYCQYCDKALDHDPEPINKIVFCYPPCKQNPYPRQFDEP